jgi:hypothetical protein
MQKVGPGFCPARIISSPVAAIGCHNNGHSELQVKNMKDGKVTRSGIKRSKEIIKVKKSLKERTHQCNTVKNHLVVRVR